MSSVLSLGNVRKSYGSGKSRISILKGASLELKAGEIVALVGPSGSGKSTLLYVAGLLDRADSGSVSILGSDASRLSDYARTKMRAASLGFVYQSHNLFPDFTALENVAISCMIAGAGRLDAMESAAAELESLGLGGRLGHRLAELSGGEAQRVAIARAFVRRPRLILADEPTGNLDPYNSEEVFSILLGLVARSGTAALVATHNPLLARKMHRRVALLDGKLSDMGSADGLKALKSSPVGRKMLDSFG
ncbi:MAG: ABC transporter ATP-binding protein [Rickettsiales bacterium]|jgi:lipoprotein-releasing system ATP-binding protein|nr:ABC transporter ATP-binding protein [Rickettsiales bacterium]